MHLLIVLALLVIAAADAVSSDATGAVIAAIAAFAVTKGGATSLIAAVLAAIFGKWAVAGLAAANFAVTQLIVLRLLRGWNRPDTAALAAAFNSLPGDVLSSLRLVAGTEPVNTWHMVAAAVDHDPEPWRSLLGKDPGRRAYDGPTVSLDDGACSQFAAEAAALARALGNGTRRPITLASVASAAVMVPCSCADEWVSADPSGPVLQMSREDLWGAVQSFTKTPAAYGMLARNRRAELLGAGAGALNRQQLASLTRRQAILLRVMTMGPFLLTVGVLLSVFQRQPPQGSSAQSRPAKASTGKSDKSSKKDRRRRRRQQRRAKRPRQRSRREVIAAMFAELRSLVFSRPSAEDASGFFHELQRLYLADRFVAGALRFALVLIAGVAAAFVVSPIPWAVSGHGIGARVPALITAIGVAIPVGRKKRGIPTALVVTTVAVLVFGYHAWTAAGIGLLCGLATPQLQAMSERRSVLGRTRGGWKPPRGLRLRPRDLVLREIWGAADEAAQNGRTGVAIEMLDAAARGQAAGESQFASECNARIALWELERGRLEAAAQRLDLIGLTDGAQDPSSARLLSPIGNLALGMLEAELGDDDAASTRLGAGLAQAVAQAPLRRDIALRLAEINARGENSREALAVLNSNPPPRWARSSFTEMIERDVIAASALAGAGDRLAAQARLKDLTRDPMADGSLASLGADAARAVSAAEGRALLLAGRLEFEDGAYQEARDLLNRAVTQLSAKSETQLRAIALILLGCVSAGLDRGAEALDSIRRGIGTLEDRRGQLHSSRRRTAMIMAGEDVYEHALVALEHLNQSGLAEAGLLAAVLIESLRRSSIAQLLSQSGASVSAKLRAISYDVDESDGDESDSAHAAIGAELSTLAAKVYVPAPTRISDLQAVASRCGHVLSYYVAPRTGTAWCAWMSPGGQARIERVSAQSSGDTKHPLERLRDREGYTGEELFGPWDDCGEGWQQLADALLPRGLRELITSASEHAPVRLLVIPDGHLAAVAWPALSVGGEPLVKSALIQLVPSYDLAATASAPTKIQSPEIVAHATPRTLAVLRESLTVVDATGRQAFLQALERLTTAGAYLGAHGELTGARQRVEFRHGEWLSADGALRHRWPDWVIFAACVVGHLETRSGGEPFGLPIACMLGGASTVIASVVQITGEREDEQASVTVKLFGEVAVKLCDGLSQATVLREAQLRYLRAQQLPSVADGLGAICLSTRPLPAL